MVLVDFKDYILSDPLQYMISQKIIHRTLVFSVEWLCLNSYVLLRSIDLVHTSDIVCSFDFSWYQNICEFVMAWSNNALRISMNVSSIPFARMGVCVCVMKHYWTHLEQLTWKLWRLCSFFFWTKTTTIIWKVSIMTSTEENQKGTLAWKEAKWQGPLHQRQVLDFARFGIKFHCFGECDNLF